MSTVVSKLRSIPWKPALAALAFASLTFSVARVVQQPATNRPRVADVRAAERELAPRAGQQDSRAPAVATGWIAGNAIIEPADREVRLAVTTAGRVATIAVREGQFVHRGDLLLELDSAVERASLAAAEGDLLVSRAELTRALRGNRREDRDAADADLAAARTRAALSATQLTRITSLHTSANATRDELDRAESQASIDRASLAQVEARRNATVRGSRAEDIAVASARVRAAEARRDQARAQLDRLALRAPCDGEVLQLKLRAGEYASPAGDPALILGDTRSLRARIDVDEREYAGVRVGAEAAVTVDAFGDRRFNGRVVEVARRFGRRNVRTDDPAERVDTKIIEVVVSLDEREGLVAGQRALGHIRAAGR
jgi:multidrug resistance efflux pump